MVSYTKEVRIKTGYYLRNLFETFVQFPENICFTDRGYINGSIKSEDSKDVKKITGNVTNERQIKNKIS